jgi:hypothetical protein
MTQGRLDIDAGDPRLPPCGILFATLSLCTNCADGESLGAAPISAAATTVAGFQPPLREPVASLVATPQRLRTGASILGE